MQISYGMAESFLGWLLAATSERGLCSVMLGDNQELLLLELRKNYPRARIVEDKELLQSPLSVLLDCLAGKLPPQELALDEQGTPFQLQVWEELRRIPLGETIAYGELAARIGRPRAVRAVAQACARNPLAIITPCHRVVRMNGELGGYYWGTERKRRLLQQERQ